MKCLFGMSIIAPDFILVELGNSDGRQDIDDRNYDQQFYECEGCCSLVCYVFA